MALIYIFKWDFGQPVPSNLSKVVMGTSIDAL